MLICRLFTQELLLLIDTHCHLHYNVFYKKMDDVIDRARDNSIKILLTISVKLSNFEKVYKISKYKKEVCCSIGVHTARHL